MGTNSYSYNKSILIKQTDGVAVRIERPVRRGGERNGTVLRRRLGQRPRSPKRIPNRIGSRALARRHWQADRIWASAADTANSVGQAPARSGLADQWRTVPVAPNSD